VARNRRKFSPEFKEEAAKMVMETSRPITHVARELNINETTLGNWVKEYRETHADDEPALPVSEELGIRQSVGRTGICFDNALAESVNGTLKVELVHRTVYATRRRAREDIARWIELRYNRTRLHSGLGYRTPQEVMDQYLNGQETA